jgi:hypothetical protein
MNLTQNAGFPVREKRGNYKLYERINTKQRIREMIIDGYTYESIMRELGISERTLYRYRDIIFQQEDDFLHEILTPEQMRRQVIIARDRLLDDRLTIKQWLRDNPNAPDRTALLNLSAEITAAVLRLYAKAPAQFIRTETGGITHAVVEALRKEKEKELSYSEENVRQQNGGDI